MYPRIRARSANVSLWLLGHNSNFWASIKNTDTPALWLTHTAPFPPSNCICEYEQVGLYGYTATYRRPSAVFIIRKVCERDNGHCVAPPSRSLSGMCWNYLCGREERFESTAKPEIRSHKLYLTDTNTTHRCVCVWVRKSGSSKSTALACFEQVLIERDRYSVVRKSCFELRLKSYCSHRHCPCEIDFGGPNHKHSNSVLWASWDKIKTSPKSQNEDFGEVKTVSEDLIYIFNVVHIFFFS